MSHSVFISLSLSGTGTHTKQLTLIDITLKNATILGIIVEGEGDYVATNTQNYTSSFGFLDWGRHCAA